MRYSGSDSNYLNASKYSISNKQPPDAGPGGGRHSQQRHGGTVNYPYNALEPLVVKAGPVDSCGCARIYKPSKSQRNFDSISPDSDQLPDGTSDAKGIALSTPR